MKNYRYILLYLLMVIVQILLGNFFPLSRWVLISLLPALLLALPLDTRAILSMLLAFALGFAVDFFSNGMLGLTSLALVPAGLVRGPVIRMVFGDELSSRGDKLSLQRLGAPKMTLALILLCSLFFLVYIWADSASTVVFWQGALRFALSVLVSVPVCVFVMRLLRP